MSAMRLPSTFYYKVLFSIAYGFAKLKSFGPKFSVLSALGKCFWEFILKSSAISPAGIRNKKVKGDIVYLCSQGCV